MQHLDEGTIHAWLDQALAPAEAARVSAHVDACASCAARVAEARGLIAGASRVIRALDSGTGATSVPVIANRTWPGTSRPRRASRWVALPASAAAVMLLVAGLVLVQGRAPQPVAPPIDAAMPVDTAAPAPATSVAAAPVAADSPVARTAATAPSVSPPRTVASTGATRATKARTPLEGRQPSEAAPTSTGADLAPAPVDSPAPRAEPPRRLRAVMPTGVVGAASALESARPGAPESARASASAGATASAAPAVATPAVRRSRPDCYEAVVENPNAAPPATFEAVPSRFRLTRTPVADSLPTRFIVTPIAARDARATAAKASWQPFGTRGVLIWPAQPETLRMSFDLRGTGRAWLGAPSGPAVPVRVRAVPCP